MNVPHVVGHYGTQLTLTISMEYRKVKPLVDQSIEFPITQENLVKQLGEVELTPPAGDAVLLSEILTQANEQGYMSAERLYTTIVGNLDESFIGRKYYDDRGGSNIRLDDRRFTQYSF